MFLHSLIFILIEFFMSKILLTAARPFIIYLFYFVPPLLQIFSYGPVLYTAPAWYPSIPYHTCLFSSLTFFTLLHLFFPFPIIIFPSLPFFTLSHYFLFFILFPFYLSTSFLSTFPYSSFPFPSLPLTFPCLQIHICEISLIN